MSEHPTKQELEDYRRRVLAPAEFLSVHRHVTACPLCAAQCNSVAQSERDLGHLHEALISAPDDTPYHLSAVEASAYVRGTLDEIDLEIAESHLEVCATCQREIEQLKVQPVVTGPRRWFSFPFTNSWQPVRVAMTVLFAATLILLALWLLRSKPAENTAAGPQNSSTPDSQVSSQPQPQPDTQFALVLNDSGRKVTVDQRGSLAGLEQLPVRVQERVRAALQTGRLEAPAALAQLAGQQSTLLGESGNGVPFRLIGPLGQIVRNQQPTFRWRALPGAQSYKVTVTDADLNEVATSPPLNTTQWKITKPLQPGGIYSWQVAAMKDGVAVTSPVLPAPQARFKVIDSSTARMLQQAEHTYSNSHLTLGVLYAESGLLDEAEQQLRILVRDNPNVTIADQLLRNVHAMRAARN
jgi:hypothetical protein